MSSTADGAATDSATPREDTTMATTTQPMATEAQIQYAGDLVSRLRDSRGWSERRAVWPLMTREALGFEIEALRDCLARHGERPAAPSPEEIEILDETWS